MILLDVNHNFNYDLICTVKRGIFDFEKMSRNFECFKKSVFRKRVRSIIFFSFKKIIKRSFYFVKSVIIINDISVTSHNNSIKFGISICYISCSYNFDLLTNINAPSLILEIVLIFYNKKFIWRSDKNAYKQFDSFSLRSEKRSFGVLFCVDWNS